MKKLLLAFGFLAVTATAALSWTQTAPLDPNYCVQNYTPYGAPQAARSDASYICRRGYFLMHDNQAKIPVWVAWQVSPATVNGCIARSNAFVADQSLPANKRSTPSDYAGSGYDQGHLANDAHQSWDQQVEYESFLMTNMSPQLPGLNRGIWKLLETATGAWTFSRQHILIVHAGNIYNVATAKKIGAGQVAVPDYLWKVVIDRNTNEVLAFLFPQKEGLGNDLTQFQVSIADLEKYTGIVFAVPQGHNKAVKSPIWPVDFKAVADNKKAVCKG
jgi:endonuclease G, mitochondrial